MALQTKEPVVKPTEPEQPEIEGEEEEEEEEVNDPRAVLRQNRKLLRENNNLRSRLESVESDLQELAEIKRQSMTEQERALEAAREQARAEVEAEYRTRLLEASVTQVAAGVLEDPRDAFRLIDFNDVDPRDTAAISALIEELLEAKPYLAVQTAPVGSIEQGPQGFPPPAGDGNAWLRGVTGGRR